MLRANRRRARNPDPARDEGRTERSPLCCQGDGFAWFWPRLVAPSPVWGRRVLAWGWVREWLFRRTGWQGVGPVTLGGRVVPGCPPGPVTPVWRRGAACGRRRR